MQQKWTIADLDKNSVLNHKVAIVTGANSGIGFEVARHLAAHDCTVVMACRNLKQADEARAAIVKDYPVAKLDIMQLDLADIDSIDHFSKEFSAKYASLNILINNAGALNVPNGKTKQGLETIMGVNFFGPFALTAKLYPLLLKADGDARIVTVGSDTHRKGKIDFNNFHGEVPYNSSASMLQTYANSKLADVIFAMHLDRLFKENGIRILSVAAHPGVCATNNAQSSNQKGFNRFFKAAVNISNHLFADTAEHGALSVVQAATQQGLKGGEYFTPKSWLLKEMRGDVVIARAAEPAYDSELAKKLWQAAEHETGVKFDVVAENKKEVISLPRVRAAIG